MVLNQQYPNDRKKWEILPFKYKVPTWVATAANNAPCDHTCRALTQSINMARHLAWASEMRLPFPLHRSLPTSGGMNVVVEDADVVDPEGSKRRRRKLLRFEDG